VQVSPSFYEAPNFANVTIVFTYIERLNEIMASNPEVKPLLSSALVHMLSFTGVPWLTRGPVIQQAS